MPADEYTKEWLEYEAQLGMRPRVEGDVYQSREAFNQICAIVAAQLPPANPIVTSRDSQTAGGVPIRIYTPNGAEKHAVAVFFHAGGYYAGGLDSEDYMCRQLAQHVPCVVVSVDYRLAPEHKAPAQIEDCLEAFEWTHANAAKLNGDPDQILTIGGSAGGGLSTAVTGAIVANEKTRHMSKGMVALNPQGLHNDYIPDSLGHTSRIENSDKDTAMIDTEAVKVALDALGADAQSSLYFAVLRSSSELSHFPRSYFVNCSNDPLRDDGRALAKRLSDNGVQTLTKEYTGEPHCFWWFPRHSRSAQFYKDTIEGAKWTLGFGSGPGIDS